MAIWIARRGAWRDSAFNLIRAGVWPASTRVAGRGLVRRLVAAAAEDAVEVVALPHHAGSGAVVCVAIGGARRVSAAFGHVLLAVLRPAATGQSDQQRDQPRALHPMSRPLGDVGRKPSTPVPSAVVDPNRRDSGPMAILPSAAGRRQTLLGLS